MSNNFLSENLNIGKNVNLPIMNGLIVYYSRTGNTKLIAELLAKESNFDIEEIIDIKKRKGIIGFFRAGYDATREKLTVIKEIQKNPELYDLIILGTPIWNKRMSSAIRTYITENKKKFKNVAFFCTEGGSGGPQTLKNMAELSEKKPISTLEIIKKEIKQNTHLEKVKSFIQKLG
jgi:flavodoxin